jgi:sugar phosphate permease
VAQLVVRPQFQAVCVLSFTLTLLREAFGNWSVDFLLSLQQGGSASLEAAALKSIGFDLAGALPILLMGVLYDRLPPASRRWVIAGILAALSAVLALITTVGKSSPDVTAWLLALTGLLVYGPYSILAGVLAVESGGTDLAATAAGVIDGVGYLAAILAGYAMGRILDTGGYGLAFNLMAGLTLVSAVMALRLRPQPIAVVLQS